MVRLIRDTITWSPALKSLESVGFSLRSSFIRSFEQLLCDWQAPCFAFFELPQGDREEWALHRRSYVLERPPVATWDLCCGLSAITPGRLSCLSWHRAHAVSGCPQLDQACSLCHYNIGTTLKYASQDGFFWAEGHWSSTASSTLCPSSVAQVPLKWSWASGGHCWFCNLLNKIR